MYRALFFCLEKLSDYDEHIQTKMAIVHTLSYSEMLIYLFSAVPGFL